jgi:hypothetical protein
MMTEMEPEPTKEEITQALRDLERKGLIESRLCDDGQIRWYLTGKPYYEDAWDDADSAPSLLELETHDTFRKQLAKIA